MWLNQKASFFWMRRGAGEPTVDVCEHIKEGKFPQTFSSHFKMQMTWRLLNMYHDT